VHKAFLSYIFYGFAQFFDKTSYNKLNLSILNQGIDMGKEIRFGFRIDSLFLINSVGNANFINKFLYLIGLETKKDKYHKVQIYSSKRKLGKEEVNNL